MNQRAFGFFEACKVFRRAKLPHFSSECYETDEHYREVYLAKGYHTEAEMVGKDVHHLCFNNWCRNPHHLTLLSKKDHFDGVHEGRARISNAGKTLSAETRRKLSMVSRGRTHSPEARRKMSEAQKKNPNRSMLGKKHSAETKQKIRKVKLGKKHSAETRQKMSVAQKKYWQRKRLIESSEKIWREGDYAKVA